MNRRTALRLRCAFIVGAVAASIGLGTRGAAAATLDWKGHTWQVTLGRDGRRVPGQPGERHDRRERVPALQDLERGRRWTASEIFTTDKLGLRDVPVAGRRADRHLRQERRARPLPVRPGGRHRRRRHERDRHRVLALGPGQRAERRLDRLPGVGDDHRRDLSYTFSLGGVDALDVAFRLDGDQHHELSARRAAARGRERRASSRAGRTCRRTRR